MHHPSHKQMTDDMGKGFGQFVDEVLRGRNNKTILNSSVGLAALEIGIPAEGGRVPFDIPAMIVNNRDAYNPGQWGSSLFEGDHPLFRFSPDDFTLFGLDFPDMWRQFFGETSRHHTPIYSGENGQSLAETIGLPDLPYGEMAHFAHIGMALYDSGRTFHDLWNEPALKHNVVKILTHPDMTHTLAARGTMLTVMGLLHPLGPVVAIGVAYLCAHLVHSFFGLLERNKDTIRQIENVPVLKHIYNASGVKEWAERDMVKEDDSIPESERIDPYQEIELNPERSVKHIDIDGRLEELIRQHQAKPA